MCFNDYNLYLYILFTTTYFVSKLFKKQNSYNFIFVQNNYQKVKKKKHFIHDTFILYEFIVVSYI